jgi:hypothetical protein
VVIRGELLQAVARRGVSMVSQRVRPIDADITPRLTSGDRSSGVSRCKSGTVAPL